MDPLAGAAQHHHRVGAIAGVFRLQEFAVTARGQFAGAVAGQARQRRIELQQSLAARVEDAEDFLRHFEEAVALVQALDQARAFDRDAGDRQHAVDAAQFFFSRFARLAEIHRKGAQHFVMAAEHRRRPARLEAMRQRRPAVVLPVRVTGDVGHHHALAAPRGGTARTVRLADLQPVQGAVVCFRQARRSAVQHMPAVFVEQQQRARCAGIHRFVQARDPFEAFHQRPLCGDALQNLVLAGFQLLGALALGDVVEIDRQPVRRRIDAVLEPAVVRRIERLDLQRALFGHRLFVGEMERLPGAFRKLRPDVPADQFPDCTPEELAGLRIGVGVAPVPIQRHVGIGDPLEHLMKVQFQPRVVHGASVPSRKWVGSLGRLSDRARGPQRPRHTAFSAGSSAAPPASPAAPRCPPVRRGSGRAGCPPALRRPAWCPAGR